MHQKEQLLHNIGIVDFLLVDLGLYLDTHPTDKNALEYFNHYSRIKQQMEREFSVKYFPLRMDLADCGREWRWGLAPLPWEGECN